MKGRRLERHARAINSPKHPSNQKRHFSNFLPFAWFLYTFFSLPNTQKNTSKLLDSSFFTKNTRYCYYTQSSFPGFYILDLGFRGVDVAFLAIINTPNLLNLFLAFILLFLLEKHVLLLYLACFLFYLHF